MLFRSVANAPLTLVMSKLEQIGLTANDIHHIEYLSDKEVLKNLAGGFRWLKRNVRQDVIDYFEAFANLLEEKLLQSIDVNIDNIVGRKMQVKGERELQFA